MAAEHPINTTHRYGGANLDATVPVVRRISWGAFNLMGNAAQGAAGASQEVIGGIVEQPKDVAREAGVNVDANRPGEVLTEQQKAEAAQRARQTADTAASVGAQAGLWGFGALLLGAIAAALGGSAGRPRDVLLAAR